MQIYQLKRKVKKRGKIILLSVNEWLGLTNIFKIIQPYSTAVAAPLHYAEVPL